MLSWWRLLVSDTSTGSGYVYTSGRRIELLAASQPAYGGPAALGGARGRGRRRCWCRT